jgi:hypothetical protein
VVFRPAMIGVRRRSWRRTRRGRPPCREPGPHDINVLIYEQPQQISTNADRPAGSAVKSPKASIPARYRQSFSRVGLTTTVYDGTIAPASTSLGEASARI